MDLRSNVSPFVPGLEMKAPEYSHFRGRSFARVHKFCDNPRFISVKYEGTLPNADISSDLSFPQFAGVFDSLDRKIIGQHGENKSANEQRRTNPNRQCRPERMVSHSLSGFIHSLRGRVHSLLGDKVVFVVLAGFGFAALAGVGGGLVLDNVNRERNRILLGWLLLGFGPPLFALSFFLGLPGRGPKC